MSSNNLSWYYTELIQSRINIFNYVNDQRKINPNFSVIDLGGTFVNWTSGIRNHLVDVRAADSDNSTRMDMCRDYEWEKLFKLVDKGGKFDYAICTHTLEDLYNPFSSLDYLPRIAKSGVISMPSLRCETAPVESLNGVFFGYNHHHWIWDHSPKGILIIPKWPSIEAVARYEFAHQSLTEVDTVVFQWSGAHIPYERFVDRDYPTTPEFINGIREVFLSYKDRSPLVSNERAIIIKSMMMQSN